MQHDEHSAGSQRRKKRRLTVDSAAQHGPEHDKEHDVEARAVSQYPAIRDAREPHPDDEDDTRTRGHVTKPQVARLHTQSKQPIEEFSQRFHDSRTDSASRERSRFGMRWNVPAILG